MIPYGYQSMRSHPRTTHSKRPLRDTLPQLINPPNFQQPRSDSICYPSPRTSGTTFSKPWIKAPGLQEKFKLLRRGAEVAQSAISTIELFLEVGNSRLQKLEARKIFAIWDRLTDLDIDCG